MMLQCIVGPKGLIMLLYAPVGDPLNARHDYI